MKYRYLLMILGITVSGVSLGQSADSYQCTYGDLQRRVEILTEPGVSVPCEVHYYKDTEAPGDRQVLWSAGSEEGYCERKTEEFIAKLEGWGWDCGQGDAAASTEEEAEADSLAPSEAEEGDPNED